MKYDHILSVKTVIAGITFITVILIYFGNFNIGLGLALALDCSKAKVDAEKIICKEKALLEKDEQLNIAWTKLIAIQMPQELLSNFKVKQKIWIKESRDKCKDKTCLMNKMDEQIVLFKTWEQMAQHKLTLESKKIIGVQESDSKEIKTIEVKDVEQFIKSIASNRVLKLTGKEYDIETAVTKLRADGFKSRNIYFGNDYSIKNGNELIIHDIDNLTIEGVPLNNNNNANNKVELYVSDKYSDVLKINKSKNIVIKNIKAGHHTTPGHCEGSVIQIESSKNIVLDNVYLYGSGTYGLMIEGVDDLTVKDSVIRECTYGGINVSTSNNLKFIRTKFFNNKKFSIINLSEVKDASFEDCEFADNISKEKDHFFEIRDCKNISVKGGLFTRNISSSDISKTPNVKFEEVKFINNTNSTPLKYILAP
ncbi:MAG: right-handed parallel beta-helix repeat-containing protein [Oligoflexia bacterium]|nr:right-handed parallel beta-helix repeat-containing protein [Oligoflexia bacterium]